MTDAPNFEGHPGSDCEHRTVGPHRAWCFHCNEWCSPNGPCVRCERIRFVVLDPDSDDDARRLAQAVIDSGLEVEDVTLDAFREMLRRLAGESDE